MSAEPVGRVAWYVSHVSQYGRAELRFRAETADGATIAESPTFTGDAGYGPNGRLNEHQAALRDLLDKLDAVGWQASAPPAAEAWFAWRLRRNAW